MRTSCRYCGRTHPQGAECPRKPKGVSYAPRAVTLEDKYRRSKKWQKVRAYILERDYHMCRICFEGKYGNFPGMQLEVHHITPLTEDYELRAEEGNLISLCRLHHKDAEAGKISREELRRLAEDPPRWSRRI